MWGFPVIRISETLITAMATTYLPTIIALWLFIIEASSASPLPDSQAPRMKKLLGETPRKPGDREKRAIFDTIPKLTDAPKLDVHEPQEAKDPGTPCQCKSPAGKCFYDSKMKCRKSAEKFVIDDNVGRAPDKDHQDGRKKTKLDSKQINKIIFRLLALQKLGTKYDKIILWVRHLAKAVV